MFFEKFGQPEIVRLPNLKFKNFRREFQPQEIAIFLKGFLHADVERVCLNSIRNAVLNGRSVVSKREFLRSIVVEKRRRSLAEANQK